MTKAETEEDQQDVDRLARLVLDPGASGPAPALRAQILGAIASTPAPTREQTQRRQRWLLVISVALPLLAFVAFGAIRPGPRPTALVLTTALGSLGLATVAALVAFRRGRSMLPLPAVWLLVSIVATPCALLLWKVDITVGYEGMMVQWETRPGFRCLRLSTLLSVVPLAGALLLRKHSQVIHPRLVGGAMGAAVGAFTWVLVDLWCPVGYVPHLVLGHVLPLVLAILTGVAFGRRALGIRPG